uniref:Uncharacterized protein n=1 Tax=Oryza meridionalis TaxID=40149 RepID=A0A0E0E072_9ORYZ
MLNPITSVAEIDVLVQLGTKSAYIAQFQGGATHANFTPLWTTHSEPKQHQFFGWLLLHHKI